ncbi:MAG TPA: helix-turn-helix domain-containing protein, partial [Gammaproteobacteria bacterium]|nr:helix-turn-helix domain-containing protein [Gammaproteobacteria bacterium]
MKTSEAKTGLSDGVGEFLRRERELRHISLDDVAERTKISRRYLEAIEESRYDRLPGETFVRGFIRSYAKSVGLDPDETMLVYNQARVAGEPPPPRVDRMPIEPQPGSARPLLWLLMTGLVIVGGALFGVVGHLDAPSLPRLKWPSQAEVANLSGAAAPLMLTAAADSDTWLR